MPDKFWGVTVLDYSVDCLYLRAHNLIFIDSYFFITSNSIEVKLYIRGPLLDDYCGLLFPWLMYMNLYSIYALAKSQIVL